MKVTSGRVKGKTKFSKFTVILPIKKLFLKTFLLNNGGSLFVCR